MKSYVVKPGPVYNVVNAFFQDGRKNSRNKIKFGISFLQSLIIYSNESVYCTMDYIMNILL